MREEDIIKIIEALERIRSNPDWQVLQELLYKPSVELIEKQLLVESLSHKMDSSKLYRLQGEWERAMTTDVDKVVERLKAELKSIKQYESS